MYLNIFMVVSKAFNTHNAFIFTFYDLSLLYPVYFSSLTTKTSSFTI